MKRISVIAAAALSVTAAAASATPTEFLRFEGLTTATNVPVPDGYGGLTWANFFLADPLNYNYPNGFFNGVTSPTYEAYGDGTGSAIFGTGFHLQDAYFAAGIDDATTLLIGGLRGGNLIWVQSAAIDTGGPTRVIFNSNKYTDGVVFLASTGTGAAETATFFTVDDIRLNAVPEPAAWAMMLTGFGALGIAARRRRSLSVTA